MATQNSQSTAFLSTGVDGLDNVLNGGLTRDRLYLVEGDPGAGKTTMAIQFLIEGARLGEPVLYITLSENEVELRSIAASHGWSMDGIVIHEAIPNENILDPKEQYTLFHPSEVEIGGTMHEILATIERVRPTRVVLDSLSELQLLAGNALHYRRQVLAYKQFLAKRSCTALLLDNRSASDMDLQVRSIAHGVISLDQRTMEYGTEQRRIRVTKYRGIAFRGGLHDYTVTTGGLRVFPRLVASDTRNQRVPEQFRSGLPELDALLGGGLETGSSTLFAGPPGAGKSTLASLFVSAALKSNLRAAMFLFEESASNLLNRSEALNMDLGGALATGQLLLKQVDPAEMSPGEFSHAVCAAADGGAKVIVIDSLNGYLNAMP
ncbi:MAG: circadian clock protein KaiC, partial [Herminiimonas sp.]|nr:circadian clock protein KaiC [Herminiimonas sp.]